MEKGKTVAQNRKAWHDYFVEETYEAGIELCGTEVKSIRQGKANLKDCHAGVHNGEMFVYGMHVSPYEQGNIFNHDPLRTRRLLMHKKQIRELAGRVQRDGYTLIPVELYLKNGRVKVSLALCRGTKNYDKREAIAQRDAKRDIQRAIKSGER